jgi:hypothetical protein
MKPIFSIPYSYNKDTIMKVSKFYSKKTIYTWVIPILIGIFVAVMTFTSQNYLVTFLTILFGFFILNYMTKMSEKENEIYLNSIKYLEEVKYKIDFYKSYFEEKSNVSSVKVHYKNLYEIAETKTDYLLFTSSVQAYVLSKENIKKIEEFKEFISKFPQYKYYRK